MTSMALANGVVNSAATTLSDKSSIHQLDDTSHPPVSTSPNRWSRESLSPSPNHQRNGSSCKSPDHKTPDHSRFHVDETLDQTDGRLYVGAGGERDHSLLRFLYSDTSESHLSSHARETLRDARDFASERSVSLARTRRSLLDQQRHMLHLQRQQALVLMCRIYVGSISFELREDSVQKAFAPFGPIKSVDMAWDSIAMKHKGFAFVEYEFPEAAQLAEDQMNNTMLGNRMIKVGRPCNMPHAQATVLQLRQRARLDARVYVGSIHRDLTASDLQAVFATFGELVTFDMPVTAEGQHRGFCYLEYSEVSVADEAVRSMNLFDLGGQFLRVGRCCSPSDARDLIATALPVPTGPPRVDTPLLALSATGGVGTPVVPPPGVVIPVLGQQARPVLSALPPAPHAGPRFVSVPTRSLTTTATPAPATATTTRAATPPSRVVLLRNMVTAEEVDDSLQEEITEECGRYGEVRRVVICQERQGEETGASVVVHVFVEFGEESEAVKAQGSLHGRFFGGRRVVAEFFSWKRYQAGDLSA